MEIKTTTTETREVDSRQDYVLIEKTNSHRAEIYYHGYNKEDSHIYEEIEELKFRNPEYKYRLVLLRSVNV